MKLKINLNKLEVIDKDIDLISEQVLGETTYQGLPVYEVESITGIVVYDKEEFIKLCVEATQKAHNELIFDVELVFIAKIKTVCNNGLTCVMMPVALWIITFASFGSRIASKKPRNQKPGKNRTHC